MCFGPRSLGDQMYYSYYINWPLQPEIEWNLSVSTGFLDWSVFPAAKTLFTDGLGNISMTYYTSFCISHLCPLLYIAACAPGINHFPASLLHEMKEFIMVTVVRCEAFTVIYLGEIDWFINTEWIALCCGVNAAYTSPHAAVRFKRTRLQYGDLSWASPVATHRDSGVAGSAHYLDSVVSGTELGAST